MGEEGITRIENVNELKTNIIKYVEETEKLPQPSIDPDSPDEQPQIVLPTLAGFLEEVTLYTDLDNYDEEADRVIMMTMHSAKGLEFNNVFFCGAEEGIFPGIQAIYDPEQIEEERRLAYVCITRAKKQLYITNAAQRMIFGQTVRNRVSRFVTEIPANCCEVEDKTIRKASQAELKRASTVKKDPCRQPHRRGRAGKKDRFLQLGGSCRSQLHPPGRRPGQPQDLRGGKYR